MIGNTDQLGQPNNTVRKFLGFTAFVAGAMFAIAGLELFSVYNDEKSYEQFHPYAELTPELVRLSGAATLGCVGGVVVSAVVGYWFIRGN